MLVSSFALHCVAMKLSRGMILGSAVLSLALSGAASEPGPLQPAVDAAMRAQRGTLVVLDLRSNTILAAHDLDAGARRLATPGSTVKSFVLLELLESGKAKASDRYVCPRHVRIGRKQVDCTHPVLPGPITPSDALAWSCNAYFAEAARRLTPAQLHDALARAGLSSPSGLAASEAAGDVRTATTPEQLQLQALGEWGVLTTPLELLAAFQKLAQRRNEPNAKMVWEGMEHSVTYGMARAAHVPKVN